MATEQGGSGNLQAAPPADTTERERELRDGSPQNEADIRSNPSQSQPEEVPACQSCRKRKLKCSREMPACSQCSRLSCPCIYDHKKQKPGLKSGAVEGLNRRLEVLERLVLNRDGQSNLGPPDTNINGQIHQAAMLIANSLTSLIGNSATRTASGHHSNPHSTVDDGMSNNSEHDSPAKRNSQHPEDADHYPAKRARRESEHLRLLSFMTDVDDVALLFPPSDILETAIDLYFRKIHPWIPCVHRASFDVRWRDEVEIQKLTIMVHAMLSVAMRHLPFREMGLKEDDVDRQVRLSREVVMRNAMDRMSLENVQALVILAFDHLIEGRLSNAWPLIGCLTRTVEYLQLTRETDEKPRRALQRPMVTLGETKIWAENEERRRVFWNVFLLDRLCSVMTGWSTSLTSNDVRRRLPCDGDLWAQGGPAATPFFGIWDKSEAQIGNSIPAIPSQRSDRHVSEPGSSKLNNDPSPASYSTNVGAFAYRIEATESLSRVMSFFLQQPVDFRNRQEVGSWLTRFKELDLRLVHWKLFLPQKWKDSNKSRDKYVFKMDTNLTLAHLTHNTSMILLHQHIAYPPVALAEIVKLPSALSAETCQLAAIETAHITQKYLKHAESEIVTAQFAYCVFIAARVLLVHWKFYNVALNPEFFILLESLREMSLRWQGSRECPEGERRDLAARYASLLQTIHTRCLDDLHSRADVLFHCDIIPEFSPVPPFCMPPPPPPQRHLDGTPYRPSDTSSNRYNSLGHQPQYRTPSGYVPDSDRLPQYGSSDGSNSRFTHNPEAFYLNPVSPSVAGNSGNGNSNNNNNNISQSTNLLNGGLASTGPEAMEIASHLYHLSQSVPGSASHPHPHAHRSHADSSTIIGQENTANGRIVPFSDPTTANTTTNNGTANMTTATTIGLENLTGENNPNQHQSTTTASAGTTVRASGESPDDDLTVMSNVLMDPQFSELDRVITLHGTDFTYDLNNVSNMNLWGNFIESEF